MGLLRSVTGMVHLEITGSDLPKTLQKLSNAGICVYDAQETAKFTLCVTLEKKDLTKAMTIFRTQGDRTEPIGKLGVYWSFQKLLHRPVLVIGIALLMILTVYLPTRILFVTVEGNDSIPARQILEAASHSGIYLGASRVEVRSEKVKNRLLEAMPQLQWAGVNTRGCVAVITVRERAASAAQEEAPGVGHIVAAKDGVILSCTATAGNLLCKPGDAVRKGQILISGYTDCGLVIRAEAAQGRVEAQTIYQILAATPAEYGLISEETVMSRNFTLLLGKKRINLWKGSGNTQVTCGRMYEEYYVTLPGGYQLPLGIGVQTDWQRTIDPYRYDLADLEAFLFTSTLDYLLDHMVDGAIVSEDLECSEEEGLSYLEGSYVCTEMIGRVQAEQIGEGNE